MNLGMNSLLQSEKHPGFKFETGLNFALGVKNSQSDVSYKASVLLNKLFIKANYKFIIN